MAHGEGGRRAQTDDTGGRRRRTGAGDETGWPSGSREGALGVASGLDHLGGDRRSEGPVCRRARAASSRLGKRQHSRKHAPSPKQTRRDSGPRTRAEGRSHSLERQAPAAGEGSPPRARCHAQRKRRRSRPRSRSCALHGAIKSPISAELCRPQGLLGSEGGVLGADENGARRRGSDTGRPA